MATASPSAFLPALIAELASAIEAVGGTTIAVASGGGVTGPGWTIPLIATGALRGTARLTLDGPGVTALLHLVLGSDADTSDAAAKDLLTELTSQATSALCLKEPFAGLSLSVGGIAPGEAQPEQTLLFALSLGDTSVQVAGVVSMDAIGEAPAAAAATAVSRPAATAPPTPASMPRRTPGTTAVPTSNLEVVLDIELPLAVRFGSTIMSIRALSQIGPGSIIDMGRSPDDPVEILVCGKPIAKAEVVIVGGNYGVRITDLTSPAERLRAMEGQL